MDMEHAILGGVILALVVITGFTCYDAGQSSVREEAVERKLGEYRPVSPTRNEFVWVAP